MGMDEQLDPDVVSFAEYLATKATQYGGHLQPQEEGKFKSELMHSRKRWRAVDAGKFTHLLHSLGMGFDDVAKLSGWLRKAQDGRRLVPDRFEDGFSWPAGIAPKRNAN